MELTVNSKLYNFTVTSIRPVPGQEAELVEMIYDKTGTELAWLRSSEPNKLFGIAFKTIPEDSTGIFHILEHSVLGGSERYSVKEPFVELLKSSMKTFLNAMTFPDKTLYPVSSRNETDFLNLVGVYLDAVFAPNILRNPHIFEREGWHYEFDGEDLMYNGVVFNEMKGAMSSVDQAAAQGIMNLVFPDNCYRFNSGGDPRAIPDLTYTQFLETYKRNYHPTNARVYLDGDIPLEKTLEQIDAYLGRYEMGNKQILLEQVPVSKEETITYEAVIDGSPKAQYVLGKILGRFDDKVGLLARQVLSDVLAGSNDAPLKRAVLETGLCQDLSLDLSDSLIQPFMMLRLHNLEDENSAKLEAVIHECARELVENGIPRDRLTASINHLAYQLQQMNEPQGLYRCMNSLCSWLYGGDPMQYLHFGDAFESLRAMIDTDGYEKLLQEMLVDTDGLCRLHVLPSESHGKELRQAETARLRREQAAMTSEQIQAIRENFDVFAAWQQTPDSAEALNMIPKLSLDEISAEPVMTATEEAEVNGVTTLFHKVSANGIVHLNLYFRLTDRTLEELTKISSLSRLLGTLPTAHHTAAQLQNEIKTWLGKLHFGIDVLPRENDRTAAIPVLTAKCSVLQENLGKAQELIHEILTATDFSKYDRIKEIVLQAETEEQQGGMMSGHMLAATAAQSHFGAVSAVKEATDGFSQIQWLHTLAKNFDEELPGYSGLIQDVLAASVCRSRMTVSVTADHNCDLTDWLAQFPVGTPVPDTASFVTTLPRRLGIRIPAQVSYASVGYHLEEAGTPYNGTARLVSNLISFGYLWGEIRVQGGAYGGGCRIGQSGSLFTYSFRDPSPARSLGVYRKMSDFVRGFAASGEDITGFIISAISETEPLAGPAQLGSMADRDWFAGYGHDQAVAERQTILGASAASLEYWCKALDDLADKAAVCVVGYQDALDSCQDENLTILDI